MAEQDIAAIKYGIAQGIDVLSEVHAPFAGMNAKTAPLVQGEHVAETMEQLRGIVGGLADRASKNEDIGLDAAATIFQAKGIFNLLLDGTANEHGQTVLQRMAELDTPDTGHAAHLLGRLEQFWDKVREIEKTYSQLAEQMGELAILQAQVEDGTIRIVRSVTDTQVAARLFKEQL